MRKQIILLSLVLLFFTPVILTAQVLRVDSLSVTYSGTVSDSEDNPLSGVHIYVQDGRQSTVSDTEGRFSISVENPYGKQLIFSHISMKTLSFPLDNVHITTGWQVVMEMKVIAMGEVKVTALGIQRAERAISYSVSTIAGKELIHDAIDPISALQGKVAGLNIAGSEGGVYGRSSISLRGVSTLSPDNQPLIIVDGIAINSQAFWRNAEYAGDLGDYGDELKNLNTADIEQVSVLKGAAATALYGSRGLNGAIVITTKSGAGTKGIRTTISQSVGFDKVIATPQVQMKYGPGTIAGNIYYGERDGDGNLYRWDTDQFYLNSDGVPSLIGGDSFMFGPEFDGRTIKQYDGTMGVYSPAKNGLRNFYNTGWQSNTNATVRGSLKNSSFYLSLGHRYAGGTMPRSSFNRSSILAKVDQQFGKRITLGGQLSFAHSLPANPLPTIGEHYVTRAVNTLYDPDYYRHKYKADAGRGISDAAAGDKYGYVPMKSLWWQIYESSFEQRETSVRPSLYLSIKATDWLEVKAESAMDFYSTRRESKELGQGEDNSGDSDVLGGRYSKYTEDNREQNYALTISPHKQFGYFSVSGFARAEYRNSRTTGSNAYTAGGLKVPGVYTIENSRNTPFVEDETTAAKKVFSLIGAASIGWRDQLYLDITGRNDWSSSVLYSNGRGHFSYFYPSVSTSWIVSETFRLPSWISYGKLRASWAQVGNDAAPFVINQSFRRDKILQQDGNYIYTDIYPSTLYDRNEQLRPERKNAWEVGTDWRFLQGHIGIDVTLYKENTVDQIMRISLPKEAGTTSQMVNAGNIQNKGIEIALNTIPLRGSDWEWSVDFTYARNQNKIISLHPNLQDYITLNGSLGMGGFRVASVAKAGGDYGMLMSDVMPERDANGNIVLAWNQGLRAAYAKRSGEVSALGKIAPDFTGSVATGFRYRNFSMRALFDMRFGGLVASVSNRWGNSYGVMEHSLKYRDPANGGMSWTSGWGDSNGQSFSDGMIPEGVFESGTIINTPSGANVDVSGMSYHEAYDKGYVEPMHASTHHYFNSSWGQGTLNDSWVHELSYVAIREITVSYKLPAKFANKFRAQGANISLSARNLGYLYNSLPNKINPESLRGTSSGTFIERGLIPYTASFMATVTIDF